MWAHFSEGIHSLAPICFSACVTGNLENNIGEDSRCTSDMHQTTPYVPLDSNHLNFKPSVDKSNHHNKKKHVSGELGEPEVGNIVNLYLWVSK